MIKFNMSAYRLLVTGYWLLAPIRLNLWQADCCLPIRFAGQQPEARSQKQTLIAEPLMPEPLNYLDRKEP